MSDLYVDLDAINELARQLGTIKASLQESQEGLLIEAGRLGSSLIENAFVDFANGWGEEERQIIEGIEGGLGRVHGSIDSYRLTETKITEVAQGLTQSQRQRAAAWE